VSVEVKLTPGIGACHNYVSADGKKEKITIVIAPIGIEKRNGRVVISWACNMGATCRNPECRYSSAFKEKTTVPVASLGTTESW
jgi:hypothetical protein